MTQTAQQKRDQRARAAAGQVHRVSVWLTQHELDLATNDGQTEPAEGIRTALWYRWAKS
jgi:hypothetical protein